MSAARRVLLVSQPPDGGVSEHVRGLALGLAGHGWEPLLVTGQDSVIAADLEAAGVRVIRIGLARAVGRADGRAGRALRRVVREAAPALIHAHSSKAGAVVRLSVPTGPPVVYTPHCMAFSAAFAGARERTAYRAIEQALLPRTAAIVAVCAWEHDVIARGLAGAGPRLRTIRNGTRACRPAAPNPALAEFAGNGPLATFITALRPGKEVLSLVRAAARAASAGRLEGRVAIVGNGPLWQPVQELIERLNARDHVRAFPFVAPVERHLGPTDLNVLVSTWEALPISVLEAMACGVPTLASDVGGVAEAVGPDTGVLIPAGDESALERELIGLLAAPERLRALGTGARARWERDFTLERCVAETAALYDEVAGGHARPSPRRDGGGRAGSRHE